MIDEGGGTEAGLARALIPPRPNLGPEPWDDGGWTWPGAIAAGAGSALALAALVVGWRWTRARRGRASAGQVGADAAPATSDPRIAAAEAARAALVRAFGPSWRSKTSEEIAADLALRDRLGPDRLDELVALFLRADRVKFADPSATPDDDPPGIGFDALVRAIGDPSPPGQGRR